MRGFSGAWSGKPGSNWRPQPWQGCALPTELFPQRAEILATWLCLSSHIHHSDNISGRWVVIDDEGPSSSKVDQHGPDRHPRRDDEQNKANAIDIETKKFFLENHESDAEHL